MKKVLSKATLALYSLLPTAALAYTAPSVGIKDPNSTDLKAVLNTVIGWILLLVGGIAVLFLVWGGIQYVTSSGNKDKAEAAKQTITYAVLGLIVIVLAEVIVVIVTGLPTDVGITK